LDDFHRLDDPSVPVVDPVYIMTEPIAKMTRGGAFDDLANCCMSASRRMINIENGFNEPTGVRIVVGEWPNRTPFV
jgi:hypothetical protein